MSQTIFEHLIEEHDEMKAALGQLHERGYDRHIFEQVATDLEKHMEAEEEVLYDRVRDEEGMLDLVLEGIEEHRVARMILRELESQERGTDRWNAKLKVLKESTEHHIEEEEGELFPKAKTHVMRDEAMRMTEEFEKARRRVHVSV